MLLFLIFALIVTVLAYLIYDVLRRQQQANLIERLNFGLSETNEQIELSLWDGASDFLQLTKIQNLLYKSPFTREFDLMLRRCMIQVNLYKAMVIFLLASIVPAIPAYFYFRSATALIISLLVLPLILWMVLKWKSKSQQRKIDNQLIGIISSFLTTINAGGTPIGALQSITKHSPEPMASTIGWVLESIQLGKSPAVAWQDWADFWNTRGTRLLATGIKIKWETGGQMSAILRHVMETLEFNRRMQLRVSTLTAQSKLSALVLSLLPVALAFLTRSYRPDLFDVMITDPLGQKLSMVAIALTIVGYLWLRRIAELKD